MAPAYNSEMYVAVGGAWQRAGMRLMRQVEIPASYRILDVGCGSGDLTAGLARCVPEGEVVGLDTRADLLARGAETALAGGLTNIRWVTEDLLNYEPADGFNLVYCNSTLHLVRPGLAATVRLAKWVRPGGKLALQTPAKDLSDEVHRAIEAGLKAVGAELPFPTWSSPWYLPPTNELAATVRDQGLTDIRAMEEFEPLSFRSGEDAAAYFRGLLLGPYLDALPPAKHEDFLHAFGEAFPLENGMPGCLLKRVYLVASRPA